MSPASSPAGSLFQTWRRDMTAASQSPNTIRNRIDVVKAVARHAGTEPFDLSTDDVLDYLARPRISANSRRTYHLTMRAWFSWLMEHDLLDEDPLDGIDTPSGSRRVPRTITTTEIRDLLHSGIRRRTQAMVLLGAYQGLRASEIARVRGSDLNVKRGVIRVLGKGDKEVVRPLHPVIAALADSHPRDWWFPQRGKNRDSRSDGPVLGASVSSILCVAMHRAGLESSAHSLRRWHASTMVRAGVDLHTVKGLMRHEHLTTTQLYLPEDDDLMRAGIMTLPDVTKADAVVTLPAPSWAQSVEPLAA